MPEQLDPNHDVFLSYSSRDKAWADAACSVLERNRVRCWIAPRDITPGEEWGAAIIRGINCSRIFVLIFSGHANASEQVRREVERAISREMIVLPVRIENVLPEGAMEYALGNRHWLDAFAPPMERQLESLARSVKTLLGNDFPTAVEVAEPTQLPISPGATRWSCRNRTAVRIAVAAVVIFACISALLGTVLFRGWWRPRQTGGLGSHEPPPVQTVQTDLRPSLPTIASEVPSNGFVRLFDGLNVPDWRRSRIDSGGAMRIEQGVLVIFAERGPVANFVTRDSYSNFHLRAEIFNHSGENGNLILRYSDRECTGYMVMCGDHIPGSSIGSLTRLIRNGRHGEWLRSAKPIAVKSGSWFRLEVIATGARFRVYVDDNQTVDHRDSVNPMATGTIRLGCLRPRELQIRKLEIKELPESSLDD